MSRARIDIEEKAVLQGDSGIYMRVCAYACVCVCVCDASEG